MDKSTQSPDKKYPWLLFLSLPSFLFLFIFSFFSLIKKCLFTLYLHRVASLFSFRALLIAPIINPFHVIVIFHHTPCLSIPDLTSFSFVPSKFKTTNKKLPIPLFALIFNSLYLPRSPPYL